MESSMMLFAFLAGAAAFFAPCSAAMLPGYVAFAVGPGASAPASAKRDRMPLVAFSLVLGGAAPLATSILAFVVSGFGGIYVLPAWVWRLVPPFQASLVLLVGGAGAVLAGLLLGGRARLAARGAFFALMATAGAFTTLLLVGLPIALLAEVVTPYLWWGSTAVGALLVILGAMVLADGTIPIRLPNLLDRFAGPPGFFKFGLAYGVAGLTCTFPAFLAIMAAATVSGGAGDAIAVFLGYAAGKGVALVALTITVVAGGSGLSATIGRHTRWITRASGLLLILAGAYMVYYFAWPTSPARIAG